MGYLKLFKPGIQTDLVGQQFTFNPHPLCSLAVDLLQQYLDTQDEWKHNFGLSDKHQGPIIGKMFGILVVETPVKELGYLAAFSGKLSDRNVFTEFVPPVFDTLSENGFLTDGMQVLSAMSVTLKNLKETRQKGYDDEIHILQQKRKAYSVALQQRLFDSYYFLNQAGEEKSLREIFTAAGYKNPPAGAGECAAPKLLNYAFKNQLRPIALSEFWWGQSPKSATWKHQQFYTPCKEKCAPILAHMLEGIY